MIKTIQTLQTINNGEKNISTQKNNPEIIIGFPVQQSFDFGFDFQPDTEIYRDIKLNDNLIKLESRRYIGNKSKLADWIINIILTQTENCHSFLDIFAGTATVSKRAFAYFQKVIVNDILYSNNIIYKAFFEAGIWDKKK